MEEASTTSTNAARYDITKNVWMPWIPAGAVTPEMLKEESQQGGTAWINLLACRDLPGVDSSGTSDPYVQVFVPASRHDGEPDWVSPRVNKTCNPTWSDDLEGFSLNKDKIFSDSMRFEVWDWNRFKKNVLIGQCELQLDEKDIINNFPAPREKLKISRSLGQGKGFIDLEIASNLDPESRRNFRTAVEAREKSKHWTIKVVDFTAKSDGDLTKKINIRVSPSVPLDPLFDLPQVKMFENVRPDGSAVRLIITYNTVYSDAKWDIKWKGKTPELLKRWDEDVAKEIEKELNQERVVDKGVVTTAAGETLHWRTVIPNPDRMTEIKTEYFIQIEYCLISFAFYLKRESKFVNRGGKVELEYWSKEEFISHFRADYVSTWAAVLESIEVVQ